MTPFEIELANPRGFCAGVDRAIEIVERALKRYGAPIFVRHEVVHNRFVVSDLKQKGAVFVDELEEVPDNSTVIFSAHGVARTVQEEARSRRLRVLDAACPLVTKVHTEVSRYGREGKSVILVGHAGHPEVVGTMGQALGPVMLVETVDDADQLAVDPGTQLAYVTQTTLSVDDTARILDRIRERFPEIEGPRRDDICYATQNRQDAVRKIARRCDVVLVVGSVTSSNSNRLRELAQQEGTSAYLIDGAEDVRDDMLDGAARIGVTAGASAPEVLVVGVIRRLQSLGGVLPSPAGPVAEGVSFSLPLELRESP
ncbi:MAG TPA: 4-hydroxy-3-methylbut-2-enyl diphosphate reductase [Gammaproteobacteria bacterium]|nr:4-hydroxy-3-methylbut-2-enyl diphosphate reductase [Acidiferrobacteraceae bacterium]MDP6552452.1 4-hydroxy-3-methylbut-2-enyl diphosphate reductase [Arenicellales bacterium]MDP6792091.1 4-hydroxy-3-methylbut-2-enyl diphosphate reductase [Arenicellales bacterium]MDP6918266.1 4-hydroxy-3-methylbut-2-enyl diphosphate reductase [Arenicellales bacterium]HCX86519.1 4-hydroxy-3-methylbut-2-enyl diphosphate reductase [Gammaproteobacteria bacterium]